MPQWSYSYDEQKDKDSYRIAVKNLSKRVEVQYVGGYQSSEAALADTVRLQHSKRFKTFEKLIEEDWLLPL